MTMKMSLLLFFVNALISNLIGQEMPGQSPPEAQALIVANDRAYEAAYAKADVKALADFYADDAEYTTDLGKTFHGREEIEVAIREGLSGAAKGSKLAIQVDSVRVLASDVILEKGTTAVTAESGDTSGALYTAIHVRRSGRWKISQLVETPLPDASPRDRLSELEWLVGRWEEDDPSNNLTVESRYSWARGGNFLTRNIRVTRAGEAPLEGWQIIGWNPVEEQIQSWTFDAEGGFAEAVWTREGDRWLIRETGVAPGGSRSGADHTLTKLGPDRLAWESNNRTLDGEPRPGIARIEANRVNGG